MKYTKKAPRKNCKLRKKKSGSFGELRVFYGKVSMFSQQSREVRKENHGYADF